MTAADTRPHRDFLAIPDYSREELLALFDLAGRMKSGEYRDKPLTGMSLAMIFMKASTRTRVSFEVGAWQLGAGHVRERRDVIWSPIAAERATGCVRECPGQRSGTTDQDLRTDPIGGEEAL